MKYHIDTIPIWDAYQQQEGCSLCALEYKSENEYIDFYLSGSVMEPSTRIEVNEVGFCPNHFKLLYKEKNRLGLALISHTHLRETIKKLEKLTNPLIGHEENGLVEKLSGLFPKKMSGKDTELISLINYLDEQHDSCMVCHRIQSLLERYAYTILHMWQKEEAFEEVLRDSGGFCLNHLSLILRIASETLSSKVFDNWVNYIIPIQLDSLKELDEDLLWFTKKFDYRNQDKPWGNSRDALPRTLEKLSGSYMEAPSPKDEKKD
ncbi:MAG TPA: DUF6062 family protein [Clostridia bacterium]|nr:DUF6062 family protein [Clostridia bacterium]